MKIVLGAERQVTFPAAVCEAMHLTPGMSMQIVPGSQPEEWIIRSAHIREEKLAPLKGKLPQGVGSFDLEAFRAAPKDHASLRD